MVLLTGAGLAVKGLVALQHQRLGYDPNGVLTFRVPVGGPVMASHSNCRAIVPTDRQLSDEMIKAIAGRGGLIGINFYDKFLLRPEEHKTRRARLYLELGRRPPVYMSAFHEGAAEVAGRLADGLWTLGDPMQAPAVIAAYRRGAEQAGREPGEIVLQTLAAWAGSDEAALAGSREWKGTLVDEHYTDAIADPAELGRHGAEVSDRTFKAKAVLAADPEKHVKRIRLLEKLGATAVCVMNISGSDPLGTIRTYGEHVLPALRG